VAIDCFAWGRAAGRLTMSDLGRLRGGDTIGWQPA
jgi:hypothetical protein